MSGRRQGFKHNWRGSFKPLTRGCPFGAALLLLYMKKLIILFCLLPLLCTAQNDRVHDNNDIVWGQVFTTINLAPRWDVLAEYQWRRTNQLKDWQQNFARTAVQYRTENGVSFAIGYAWAETFPYGDYPVAANGAFPEHRLFEQVQLKNAFGKLALTQRLRIEQRWIGKRKPAEEREMEDWLFSHRFRHMVRLQHPVIDAGSFNLYAAAADEVFIAAGKNVGANVFDQNRIMLILGSKISKAVSVEAGYINQTAFQGRRINGATIMQNNNGATLALILSL